MIASRTAIHFVVVLLGATGLTSSRAVDHHVDVQRDLLGPLRRRGAGGVAQRVRADHAAIGDGDVGREGQVDPAAVTPAAPMPEPPVPVAASAPAEGCGAVPAQPSTPETATITVQPVCRGAMDRFRIGKISAVRGVASSAMLGAPGAVSAGPRAGRPGQAARHAPPRSPAAPGRPARRGTRRSRRPAPRAPDRPARRRARRRGPARWRSAGVPRVELEALHPLAGPAICSAVSRPASARAPASALAGREDRHLHLQDAVQVVGEAHVDALLPAGRRQAAQAYSPSWRLSRQSECSPW